MHISLQGATPKTLEGQGTSEAEIREVCARVVDTEAAKDLVVLLYFRAGVGWAGACHPDWLKPADVHNGTVKGLPQQHFRLIRIAMGTRNTYPFTGHDAYNWQWAFGTFADHLAEVLAHECSHLRRPAGQEAGANDFALERTLALDFDVAGAPPDGR
jgi:hypothetical protein